MTAQTLIDLLSDHAPQAEVKIAVDSFVTGDRQSLFEGEIVRVEIVSGKPFLIGEKR